MHYAVHLVCRRPSTSIWPSIFLTYWNGLYLSLLPPKIKAKNKQDAKLFVDIILIRRALKMVLVKVIEPFADKMQQQLKSWNISKRKPPFDPRPIKNICLFLCISVHKQIVQKIQSFFFLVMLLQLQELGRKYLWYGSMCVKPTLKQALAGFRGKLKKPG